MARLSISSSSLDMARLSFSSSSHPLLWRWPGFQSLPPISLSFGHDQAFILFPLSPSPLGMVRLSFSALYPSLL
jgi:hypothetical protein